MSEQLPEGYSARRPTLDDIPALVAHINACELADTGEVDTTMEHVHRRLTTGNVDRTRDAWLIIGPDGHIVADAFFGAGQTSDLWGDLRVAPAQRRQRLGAYLLAQLEQRAHEALADAPAGARVTLSGEIDHRMEAGRRLCERAGYALERSFWRMSVELDPHTPPPAPQWPQGISVRTFVRGQDERALFDTIEAAFQDHWEHTPARYEEWVTGVNEPSFDPSLVFLAMAGEEVAGSTQCRYHQDVGWVGKLAVRRPWRKQGLGMALLTQAFGEFHRRGRYTVQLGVDAQSLTGATRLYERAGMRPVRQWDLYRKTLRPGVDAHTPPFAE